MVIFQKVSKAYPGPDGRPRVALRDVSFELRPGECCCLLGPNGAGKTTLMRMMMGFLAPTDGEISVWGTSVRRDPVGVRRHISYIPDEVALYRNLTGRRNLEFFASLVGRSDTDLVALASTVGLAPEALDRKLMQYSKGMRQRLAVAVSLLKDAHVYAFDEPTNGLDAIGLLELIATIKRLRDDGKVVLVTTHDLLHVNAFATRVLFLMDGKIHQEIREDDLASVNLEHLYVELISRRSALKPD